MKRIRITFDEGKELERDEIDVADRDPSSVLKDNIAQALDKWASLDSRGKDRLLRDIATWITTS